MAQAIDLMIDGSRSGLRVTGNESPAREWDPAKGERGGFVEIPGEKEWEVLATGTSFGAAETVPVRLRVPVDAPALSPWTEVRAEGLRASVRVDGRDGRPQLQVTLRADKILGPSGSPRADK